ncbi:hydroxyisourate hydrolase [Rhodococcus sp. IEGM 1408]|uniref:hydroxyisourate hydrolase n=1 Tax=Rhodococcus sp. IEGM 1408 TaxID=3082220 RepID=UPI002954FBCD|nr:hydroxyisourate hydrolase [Rhodococcus sp. IEGM 1408]MDV8001495.1 hydroxyisourate hydrolase [Rhodococcus sp. IEGM 1408]
MSISTHVLDTAAGSPAIGLAYSLANDSGSVIASGVTDADGRGPELNLVAVPAGVYRMTFDTGAYQLARGETGFYPEAVVCFQVTDPAAHHHVPLILSPFGYSTYRGS